MTRYQRTILVVFIFYLVLYAVTTNLYFLGLALGVGVAYILRLIVSDEKVGNHD